MSKRVLARAGALVAGVALAAGAVVAFAAPAYAAPLGTVNLSQSSGTVTDSPFFASATTSAPCPATFGEEAALRVGRAGGPYSNLAPLVGGGGFDQNPVTISPNRSFQTALGAAPGSGLWEIVFECYSLTAGRHPDRFVTTISVTGNTWRIPVAEDTTTALTVAPPSPVNPGTQVTLTATVTPATAVGQVEFRRGTNVIGSAPVAGGTASVQTTTLPSGTFSLTAVFTPTDPSAFRASTSAPVSYTVNGPIGGDTKTETITADIAPGAFSLAVAGNTVVLANGTVGGTATGALQKATVTDLRGTNSGWNLTGQLTNFTGAGTIPAGNLSWTPTAAVVDASGQVVAGSAANLGDVRTLCSAASGSSAGVFACDAGLSLDIPDNVPPGGYTATLTLTLA